MFLVHLLGCVILGVLSAQLPIPSFHFSSVTTSVTAYPTSAETTSKFDDTVAPTSGLQLSDFQELFSKILAADIIHFKTTPSIEEDHSKSENVPTTYPSLADPFLGENNNVIAIRKSPTRSALPSAKDDLQSLPYDSSGSSVNSTGLLSLMQTPSGLSVLISLVAFACSLGN